MRIATRGRWRHCTRSPYRLSLGRVEAWRYLRGRGKLGTAIPSLLGEGFVMERTTLYAETEFQRLMMSVRWRWRRSRACRGGGCGRSCAGRPGDVGRARGRDFTRGALEGALQRQVDEVEKKLRLAASADAAKRRRHKGASPRSIPTSTGVVCLRRVYFDCQRLRGGRLCRRLAVGSAERANVSSAASVVPGRYELVVCRLERAFA